MTAVAVALPKSLRDWAKVGSLVSEARVSAAARAETPVARRP